MDTKKIKIISYIVNHAPKNSSIFYQDNLNDFKHDDGVMPNIESYQASIDDDPIWQTPADDGSIVGPVKVKDANKPKEESHDHSELYCNIFIVMVLVSCISYIAYKPACSVALIITILWGAIGLCACLSLNDKDKKNMQLTFQKEKHQIKAKDLFLPHNSGTLNNNFPIGLQYKKQVKYANNVYDLIQFADYVNLNDKVNELVQKQTDLAVLAQTLNNTELMCNTKQEQIDKLIKMYFEHLDKFAEQLLTIVEPAYNTVLLRIIKQSRLSYLPKKMREHISNEQVGAIIDSIAKKEA